MRLAALAALGLAAACGPQGAPSSPPTKPVPLASDRDTCTVAEDCALVEACCGCSAGGRRVAIRKDAVGEYAATRMERCGQNICTTNMSNDPSCNAEATCDGERCKVSAHMGQL